MLCFLLADYVCTLFIVANPTDEAHNFINGSQPLLACYVLGQPLAAHQLLHCCFAAKALSVAHMQLSSTTNSQRAIALLKRNFHIHSALHIVSKLWSLLTKKLLNFLPTQHRAAFLSSSCSTFR